MIGLFYLCYNRIIFKNYKTIDNEWGVRNMTPPFSNIKN